MTVIYALRDPENQAIRYVGKTSKSPEVRLSQHLKDANRKSERYLLRWIRTLTRKGMRPEIEVLETVKDGDNWQEREIYWIAYGRANGWNLVNTTDGGDGLNNPSDDVRQRIAEASRGKAYAAGPRSDEFKKRAAEIARVTRNRTGHPTSAETKARISQKLMGHETVRGEKNGRSKLTETEVIEIRNLYATAKYSLRKLAERFGINHEAVRQIVMRQTWAHI